MSPACVTAARRIRPAGRRSREQPGRGRIGRRRAAPPPAGTHPPGRLTGTGRARSRRPRPSGGRLPWRPGPPRIQARSRPAVPRRRLRRDGHHDRGRGQARTQLTGGVRRRVHQRRIPGHRREKPRPRIQVPAPGDRHLARASGQAQLGPLALAGRGPHLQRGIVGPDRPALRQGSRRCPPAARRPGPGRRHRRAPAVFRRRRRCSRRPTSPPTAAHTAAPALSLRRRARPWAGSAAVHPPPVTGCWSHAAVHPVLLNRITGRGPATRPGASSP